MWAAHSDKYSFTACHEPLTPSDALSFAISMLFVVLELPTVHLGMERELVGLEVSTDVYRSVSLSLHSITVPFALHKLAFEPEAAW